MRRTTLAALLACLLIVPVGFALSQDEKVPEGSAALEVHVRNELDAGFVRLRITDDDGREALDDLKLVPANGGWATETRMPPGIYHVELVRNHGVWPFASRIRSFGSIDLGECPTERGVFRFTTAFERGDQGITGPFVECAE